MRIGAGVILPWLVAEGIFTYRTVRNHKRPPYPGELLGVSGLFAVLALFEGPAPTVVSLIGWGIDIAALLNLFGTGTTLAAALSGPASSTSATQAAPSSATTAPSSTPATTGSSVQYV